VVTGLGEVDGMPVYVTNGAGFWGPPVRVGALPDITLVELRATS
jgi:predicted MPP superfamily phosphohydrolase